MSKLSHLLECTEKSNFQNMFLVFQRKKIGKVSGIRTRLVSVTPNFKCNKTLSDSLLVEMCLLQLDALSDSVDFGAG